VTEPLSDRSEIVELELLGKRVCLLELSREVSPDIPIYPGHVGIAFWDHLTHEQVRRQRLPADSPFEGYAVRGVVLSEHVSTHVDAVWHFNRHRPDMTIDQVRWNELITPRTSSAFPGLDEEASRWLLDQSARNWDDPFVYTSQYHSQSATREADADRGSVPLLPARSMSAALFAWRCRAERTHFDKRSLLAHDISVRVPQLWPPARSMSLSSVRASSGWRLPVS
jgi:hypothetical protein